LLALKFFLFYFCGERPIVIKPTIDNKICVLCNRGKKQRTKAIQTLLNNKIGNSNQRHEVDHLYYCLQQDVVNDTTLSVPGSIVVYDNKRVNQPLCEFDGIIVFPMRKQGQLVLLEAKNTMQSARASNCLGQKLQKLKIGYENVNMVKHEQDVSMQINITK